MNMDSMGRLEREESGSHFDLHFIVMLDCFDSQAVELLRRSAATATLVIERYRQPEPEGPQLEDLEDLLRTSVGLLERLNMGRFLLEIKTLNKGT